MRILRLTSHLVQLSVLACVGCLLLRTLYMGAQLVASIYFPATKVPYLNPHPVRSTVPKPGTLVWQEPFKYEAKVYLTEAVCQPLLNDRFFEQATEVWHIEPQSLANRYPIFNKHMVLNITNLGAYSWLTVFLQEAGQFSPHPNISDPLLVVSHIKLSDYGFYSRPPMQSAKKVGRFNNVPFYEALSVTTQAVWKLYLEDSLPIVDTVRNPQYPQHPVALNMSTSINGTDDTASSDHAYLPLLLHDTYAPPKSQLHQLLRLNETLNVGVNMEIRGVRAGLENSIHHVATALDGWIRSVFKAGREGRVAVLVLPSAPVAYKSLISTAVYLVLLPAFAALLIFRQLVVARHFFASAIANKGWPSFIAGAYMMLICKVERLEYNMGLVIPHKRMHELYLQVANYWHMCAIGLAILPLNKVFVVISSRYGAQVVNPAEKEKDVQLLEHAKEDKANDMNAAFNTSYALALKLMLATVSLSLAVESAYFIYASGIFTLPDLADACKGLATHWYATVPHVIGRIWNCVVVTQFLPPIIMSFNRKSTRGIPVTYHALHMAEFTVVGLLYLYKTPLVLHPETMPWTDFAMGAGSIVLVAQWAIYDRFQ